MNELAARAQRYLDSGSGEPYVRQLVTDLARSLVESDAKIKNAAHESGEGHGRLMGVTTHTKRDHNNT